MIRPLGGTGQCMHGGCRGSVKRDWTLTAAADDDSPAPADDPTGSSISDCSAFDSTAQFGCLTMTAPNMFSCSSDAWRFYE